MQADKKADSVEIFTGTIWQAEMIKNLLGNADIEAHLTNEISGTLNLPWNEPGEIGSVKVIVSNRVFEKAKVVVEEYKKG